VAADGLWPRAGEAEQVPPPPRESSGTAPNGSLCHTGTVRVIVAALLASLFAVMTTADRIACPDGCTDEASAQIGSEHPPAACALCHGWSQPSLLVAARPAPRLAARQPAAAANRLDPALPTLEPPPRA
jgi:hypothetical protein